MKARNPLLVILRAPKRRGVCVGATLTALSISPILSDALAQVPPVVAYTEDEAGVMFSTYTAPDWATPGSTAVEGPFAGDGPLHWKVARTRPDRAQLVVLFKQDTPGYDYLYATFWDGKSWDDGTGGETGDARSFGRIGQAGAPMDFRSFDAAYENESGELLVAVGTNADESLDLYVYDGTSWSRNLRFGPPGNGLIGSNSHDTSNFFDWVRLAPRPGTNQIAFIGIGNDYGDSDSAAIEAAIWDGDTNTFVSSSKAILAFPNTGPYGARPQNYHSTDAADIDFVLNGTHAGEAVAVWGTDEEVWADVWSESTGWGENRRVADLGDDKTVGWLLQEADPASDDLILVIGDIGGRIYSVRYDGDTRSFDAFTSTPLETTFFGNGTNNRPFDVVWNPAGGPNRVLLVYSDVSGLKFRESTDSGRNWGDERVLTNAINAYWVQLELDANNTVLMAVQDQNDRLFAGTWSGGPFAVSERAAANSNHSVETFALTATVLPRSPSGLQQTPR